MNDIAIPLTDAARERLERRLAELRRQAMAASDKGALKEALVNARNRRVQLLADALIADTKADIGKADLEVATAEEALLRREEEGAIFERAICTVRATLAATSAHPRA